MTIHSNNDDEPKEGIVCIQNVTYYTYIDDKEGEYYMSQGNRDGKTDGDTFRVEGSCDECCFHGCLVI